MTLYRYIAFTDEGKNIKGEIEADNERAARRKLQAKSMFVKNISNAESIFSGFSLAKLKDVSFKDIMNIEIGTTKIPSAEMVAFSRQFATLVGAGIPVLSSLDAMISQTEHRGLSRVLRKIRGEVNEGHSLAKALENQGETFTTLYINMVSAAETSGRLGPVLSELADLMEDSQRLKGELRSALTYPVVMLVVGFGVIAFLLTSVVPNITSMYSDSGQELPTATKIMLALSENLQVYGLVGLIIITLTIFSFKAGLKKSESLQLWWDKFKLAMPMFGILLHKTALTRFSGTLSALLKSGVPIITALRIATNVTPFLPYKIALKDIASKVAEGEHLGDCMKEAGIFPPLLVNMVSIGEKSGKMEEMLFRVADSYASDLRTRLQGLGSLVQPLLLLLMGGLIAFIMGAVLIPIFELNTIAGAM